MRILHFSPFFSPDVGGMETFMSRLVFGLQERGHQNLVIASQKDGALGEFYHLGEVPVHRLDLYRALLRNDVKTVVRSRRRVEQLKGEARPERIVVHVGGPVPMAFVHLSTAHVAKAPVVAIAYDLPPAGEASPTLRQLFEQASHVAAISRARLADAQLIAPAAASKMSVVYPCLPWRELQDGVPPSGVPLVLMAGRLDPAKGFGLAVQAFRLVHDQLPEARLVLVGGGPIYPELAEQIQRLGLAHAARLAGQLPDAELTRLYQQAWVSLVPSRHSESFGLVALEAMQAACPVIATDTGGLAEVVVDGETGFLVPVDDVAALSDRILALLRDRALGVRMGEAGRVRAQTHFNWEGCIANYEAILESAADP